MWTRRERDLGLDLVCGLLDVLVAVSNFSSLSLWVSPGERYQPGRSGAIYPDALSRASPSLCTRPKGNSFTDTRMMLKRVGEEAIRAQDCYVGWLGREVSSEMAWCSEQLQKERPYVSSLSCAQRARIDHELIPTNNIISDPSPVNHNNRYQRRRPARDMYEQLWKPNHLHRFLSST